MTRKKLPVMESLLISWMVTAVLVSSCNEKSPTAPVIEQLPKLPSNVAHNKPATASSSYDTASLPGKAVDGDTATVWNSGKGHPGYLEIDLQGSFTVSGIAVVLNQTPAGQTTFRAVVYNNNDSLIAARWSGITVSGSRLESNFGVTLGHVTKVRICSESTPSWVSFKEVEVNGVPE